MERKLRVTGKLGTKFRFIMDGPYAGDLIEARDVFKDVTAAFEKAVEKKLAEKAAAEAKPVIGDASGPGPTDGSLPV